MLRAGDGVDAHLLGDRDIFAFAVGISQGASLLPVFSRGLGMNNKRIGLGTFEDPVLSAAQRILQDIVGKGEEFRVELVGVLLG